MNSGKVFEQEIKKSVPKDVFYYRLRDGTASFGDRSNPNIRFQASNAADCMVFHKRLFLLELKTHTGKSLPLTAIRENQVKELSKASRFEGVTAGLLINFRDVGRTFFVNIVDIENFIKYEPRKSIPIAWCEQEGLEIIGRKVKVNYVWDLAPLINPP